MDSCQRLRYRKTTLIPRSMKTSCHILRSPVRRSTSRITSFLPLHISTVTRTVREEATVHASSLIRNQPSISCCLADASGYHSRGPRPLLTLIVTRTVREDATVHASSLIRNQPSISSCLADASGYHSRGLRPLRILMVAAANEINHQSAAASLTRRVTISWPTATSHLNGSCGY